MSNFELNRGTKTILGETGNIRKLFSILGEQFKKPIYFRETRGSHPPRRVS